MTASQWEIDGVASGGWTAIGGHSNAQGAMAAYRTPEGVWKTTTDEYNRNALTNEAVMLIKMLGSGFAPELLGGYDPGSLSIPIDGRDRIRYALLHTDAGFTEPTVDG